MAPPLAGAAIAPDEPANKVAPAIRRAEHTILMTFSPPCARRIRAHCCLTEACDPFFAQVPRIDLIRLFPRAELCGFPERISARGIRSRDGEEEEFTHETSTASHRRG